MQRLRKPVPPLPVSGELLKAARATKLTRPCHAHMMSFLASTPKLNQTEMVGVITWALGLHVGSEKQMIPALEFLRFCARIDLFTNHREEYEIILPWMESAVLAAYGRSKISKSSLDEFLRVNKSILGQFLSLPALERVMAAGSNHESVKDDLETIVSSSPIGAALYSFALVDMLSGAVRSKIQEHIEKCMRESTLNMETLNKYKFQALSAADSLQSVELLPARRRVQISVGKEILEVTVGNISSEVALRFLRHGSQPPARLDIWMPFGVKIF